MKVFRHKLGHAAGETMTVVELREKLAEYPDTMPVFGGWEGCHGYVAPANFTIERVTKGHKDDACECLVIDVESY